MSEHLSNTAAETFLSISLESIATQGHAYDNEASYENHYLRKLLRMAWDI